MRSRREDELAALGRRVDERQLVTMTSPGGAGTTRLARDPAWRIAVACGWPRPMPLTARSTPSRCSIRAPRASSVHAARPLDRCLRDARTALQHVCTQDANFELAGRQLLHRLDAPTVWALDLRETAV